MAVRAMQGQTRQGKKNVDLQMDLLLQCVYTYVRVCVFVHCTEIFYLHTCETAGQFHAHVCCIGDVGPVQVHTRVTNVYVNAIMLCLSGQWEELLCSRTIITL